MTTYTEAKARRHELELVLRAMTPVFNQNRPDLTPLGLLDAYITLRRKELEQKELLAAFDA